MCDLNLVQHFYSVAIHKLSPLTTRSFAQHLARDSGAAYWEMRGEWLPISLTVGPEFKQQRTGWICLLRNIDQYWFCGPPSTLPNKDLINIVFRNWYCGKQNICVICMTCFCGLSVLFVSSSHLILCKFTILFFCIST